MADTSAYDASESNEEALSYHQGFQSLLRIMMFMGIAIFALVCAVFYYVSSVLPQDRYYAVTASGQNIPMHALDAPNVNNDMLLSWAAQAATDIMTFGFNDVDKRFQHSRRYFSDEGWESFGRAMGKSNLLKNVTSLQQIITSIPRGTPTIAGSGFMNGRFMWVVRVPLIMTTRAGGNVQTKRMNVLLYIVKMPTTQNPLGIGIQTWK